MTSLTNHNFAKGAALSGLALFTFAGMALAQDSPSNPPNGWMPYGAPIRISVKNFGVPNKYVCAGCVNTAGQDMSADLNLMVYKNSVPTMDGFDYYLVTGPFRHAVNSTDGTNTNTKNWLSVGIFGKEMNLSMTANGARVWDSGPGTTVGTNTTGWNIGGGISAGANAEGPNGEASVSFGYSQSFSTPDVNFFNSTDNLTFKVRTSLPNVSINRTNPGGASNTGYSYQTGVIFQLSKGHDFSLSVSMSEQWDYSYTRPIVNHSYRGWASGLYQANFGNKTFVSKVSGLCMTVDNSQPDLGALPVVLRSCTGAASQQWTYTKAAQLQTALPSTNPMCLDTEDGQQLAGSAMVVRACSTPSTSQKFQVGQLWQLTRVVNSSMEKLSDALTCNVTSWTSLTVTPTSCDSYPAMAPGSAQIQTIVGGLVVTSGTTSQNGDRMVLHQPRNFATAFLATNDDRLRIEDQFFRLQ
jgi:hypothetical protein